MLHGSNNFFFRQYTINASYANNKNVSSNFTILQLNVQIVNYDTANDLLLHQRVTSLPSVLHQNIYFSTLLISNFHLSNCTRHRTHTQTRAPGVLAPTTRCLLITCGYRRVTFEFLVKFLPVVAAQFWLLDTTDLKLTSFDCTARI